MNNKKPVISDRIDNTFFHVFPPDANISPLEYMNLVNQVEYYKSQEIEPYIKKVYAAIVVAICSTLIGGSALVHSVGIGLMLACILIVPCFVTINLIQAKHDKAKARLESLKQFEPISFHTNQFAPTKNSGLNGPHQFIFHLDNANILASSNDSDTRSRALDQIWNIANSQKTSLAIEKERSEKKYGHGKSDPKNYSSQKYSKQNALSMRNEWIQKKNSAHDWVEEETHKWSSMDTLRKQWKQAISRYRTVLDEWAVIAADPLSALDHAELLDVSLPRTAVFIETFGRAQDMYAVLDGNQRTDLPDKTSVTEFADLVRKAETAWKEACRHAEHVGYGWLPSAERELARKASGLLRLASDETTSLMERTSAAEKAAVLLKRITTVVLPDTALLALEKMSTLQLQSASTP